MSATPSDARHLPRGLLIALLGMLLVACSTTAAPSADIVVALPAGQPSPPPRAFAATVERVVDGDTMVALRQGQRVRVRFIGVDSPESVKPNTPVECWGKQASALAASLLPAGIEVRAAFEPGGDTDRYQRELWDIWLADGRFVQAVLVASGAARPRAYQPQTAHHGYLLEVEQVAKQAQVGLYGSCPAPTWVRG